MKCIIPVHLCQMRSEDREQCCFRQEECDDLMDFGCLNGLFVLGLCQLRATPRSPLVEGNPCLGRSIGFIGHYLDQLRLTPQETGQELHSRARRLSAPQNGERKDMFSGWTMRVCKAEAAAVPPSLGRHHIHPGPDTIKHLIVLAHASLLLAVRNS